MTQFNPPRRQATKGVADMLGYLAMEAYGHIAEIQPMTPGRSPLTQNDIGYRHPASKCIELIALIMDSLGKSGRSTVYKQFIDFGYNSPWMSIHSNQAEHWSFSFTFPGRSRKGTKEASVVVHYLKGKTAFDVHLSAKDYAPDEFPKDRHSKNLTVEQLRQAYRTYLIHASLLLGYRIERADSEHNAAGVVNVLGRLDLASLKHLIDDVNGSHRPLVQIDVPRFTLEVHEDVMIQRYGCDDSPAWDLYDIDMTVGRLYVYLNRPPLKRPTPVNIWEHRFQAHTLIAEKAKSIHQKIKAFDAEVGSSND